MGESCGETGCPTINSLLRGKNGGFWLPFFAREYHYRIITIIAINTTFILLLFTIIYPYMPEVENIVEEEEKEEEDYAGGKEEGMHVMDIFYHMSIKEIKIEEEIREYREIL